jgi:hypothetical protein
MSSKLFIIAAVSLAMILLFFAGCILPSESSGNTRVNVTVSPTLPESVVTDTIVPLPGSRIPAIIPSAAVPLETTPAELPALKVPNGSIARYYPYVASGLMGLMPLALSTSVYEQYQKMGKPSSRDVNYTTYNLRYMDETLQQDTISDLARAIRNKEPDKNMQARVAISLVQHIPPAEGESYRYPYEVLYEEKGTPGEKAMLLASLLKQLDVGSAVFYFVPENHMTAGIKAASPYDYQKTGYAFIDTTEPTIITDDSRVFAFGTLSSIPEVIPVGTGASLTNIANDYKDARSWISAQKNLAHLSNMQYREWEALNRDYDLSYFTCQECKLPVSS